MSILDQDFDQKIAQLPHDEARASLMEHAVRAQIHERLAENPAFYERLSEQLERIIRELRDQLIDAAEACRRMAELRSEVGARAEVAAEHGLTPVSYAVYGLLAAEEEAETDGTSTAVEDEPVYQPDLDSELTSVARKVAGRLSVIAT